MLIHICRRARALHSVPYVIRCGLLLTVTLLLSAGVLAVQDDGDAAPIALGKPVVRDLVGGQSHSYRIALASGQFLYVVVDQRGVDVVAVLFGPDGRQLIEVDSPNGTRGPEPISLVAEATGDYRLEIRSLEKTAAAGRYEVRIEALRQATEEDKSRVAAQRALAEAAQLSAQRRPEALRSALQKYEEALRLFRGVGERAQVAGALHKIGLTYDSLGEGQKALDALQEALLLYRALGDRHSEGLVLYDMALAHDDDLTGRHKALGLLRQSLQINQALGNSSEAATVLTTIGSVYQSLGELRTALDYFQQALPLRRAAGDRGREATTLNNLGSVSNILGEKQKALDYFSQALPLLREVRDRRREAATLNNIGGVYDDLGDGAKALDYYNQALRLVQSIGDQRGEAITLSNIGLLYSFQGDQQSALDYFNRSLPLRRALRDRNGEATTLKNMGGVYEALGEKQKALDYYDQALSIFRSLGNRRGMSATLSSIGSAYTDLNEQQKALDALDQALSLAKTMGDRDGEATTLYHLARLDSAHNDPDSARARIEAAVAITESLRTEVGSQALRASYFATVQDYYEFYIDLLMRLHKQRPSAGHDGEALRVYERGRARSLLELLAETGADFLQGVEPELLRRERSLQQQLNAKAQQQIQLLSSPHTEEQAATVAKEIEALTAELQQNATRIRQTSPRYAALTQPRPLTLREIQTQVLDADTLLLTYALGKDRSYLWAVTPASITSYELPRREEIETAARRFYELITAPPRRVAAPAPGKREIGPVLERQVSAQTTQAASRLGQMLVGPVAPLLGRKRLLIVGDGALQYIPFAALPVPSSGAGKEATAPLITKHEIVNLPSVSTLAVLRREAAARRRAPKTLAVLADPVFERSDERLRARIGAAGARDAEQDARPDGARGLGLLVTTAAKQSGVSPASLHIPRLLWTRREADSIVKLIPPAQYKKALDFIANRATATSPDLTQFRYVHFATHGFLNSRHPELSGIALSMFNERGAPQDGFLRAHEVFNLKLAADVVVLSACQTGLGKEVRGEGLIGLTRGFMYAGSPRVVVSLWNVNDEATAELMTRFYRGMLIERLRPSKALQVAQASMLNEQRYSAPFYWAAFTLQGEWR